MDPKPPSRRGRRDRIRRWGAASLAVALVVLGGVGWALDRYVIEHVRIADVDAYEAERAAAGSATTGTDASSASSPDATTLTDTLTDTEYISPDAAITISTVATGTARDKVTYFVADVVLTDATALRSAFAQNSFGTNITEDTSDIAADNGAVLAVNGDYYGFRRTGIVIRNGVAYRDEGAREGLAFYRDGAVEVYDETATTADQLVAEGVWNTLSFGPTLVADGKIVDGIDQVEVDTNVGNHSIQGDQPRTAVGVIGTNHLIFVVVDGRSPGYSAGVTMPELARIMQDLGATTAYNLDGGGSATMVFGGELVNNPLGRGEERGTSDILYVEG